MRVRWIHIHQRIARGIPLRPRRNTRVQSRIRIEAIHEIDVVRVEGFARVVGQDPEEDLEEVGAVECTEDGGSVVVRGEIARCGNVGVQTLHKLENAATCQREREIAQYGSEDLKLRVPVVEFAGAEGRTVGVGIVESSEILHQRRGGVVKVVEAQVLDKFGVGRNI